jgi:hypothetical protein
MFSYILLLFFTFLIPRAISLKVAANSPCSALCLDPNDGDYPQSSTRPEEIVCSDSGYVEKEVGKRYQQCVACLEDSGYGEGVDWDQYWYLCKFISFRKEFWLFFFFFSFFIFP